MRDPELERIRARLRPGHPIRRPKACPCSRTGAPAAAIRTAALSLFRRRSRRFGDLMRLARTLWASPVHEERAAAVEVLSLASRALENRHWGRLKSWCLRGSCRELAEALAERVLGVLVQKDRSWCGVLRHWARSRRPSDRRIAVLATLLRTRQMADAEAALALCESLMRDRDAGVREAVGRLLKEARAADPSLVRRFLARWRRS